MKRFLPLLLLIITVVFFFKPFFLDNLLPIPSDTIVGLYNPFRDLYSSQYPRGIPFKNFLITDPVRQQFPWRKLVVDAEKHFQLPLWNPYNAAGTPLLANFQSGAFYPFNVLFFIFPFSFAWSLIIFLQSFLGALFLYFYLKNLKINSFAAIVGSISFVFSGFAIVWLEWGTIVQTALWLPLILLSVDKISEKFKVKSYLWGGIFLISFCSSLFAGHLQTFFYLFLMVSVYIFVRFISDKINKKTLLLFVISYVLFVIITLPQWLSTLQFITLSARSVDQIQWQTAGWFIPFSHLIQFVVPDFFGNPTTLNYWGTWNYGELVGYIGILPLVFALLAIIFRHDKKTWFFSGLVVVAFLFALPTPIAKLPYLLNIPFISTAQPTRLLFIIDFSLAILTGLGIDFFLKNEKKIGIVWIVGLVGIILGMLWVVVMKLYPLFGMTLENSHIAKQNLLFPTGLFLVATFFIMFYVILGSSKNDSRIKESKDFGQARMTKVKFGLLGIILVLTLFDLLRFAQKFTPFTPSQYLFPSTKALSFLQTHVGNYRIMTTDSRILPPNFSSIYGLQSVDLYDPLYLRNYAEFIAASERGVPNINPPFGFNRIITPHNYQSPLINLLGVKYLLSFADIKQSGLQKIFQEGDTQVFQNMNVLPRAFFVENLLAITDKKQAIKVLFEKTFNINNSAIVAATLAGPVKQLSVGQVLIKNYQPNTIMLQTTNTSLGFLVVTDTYYPTWHAYIDGKETRIYPTDYAFRGIFVPSGRHAILFVDQLF